MSLYSIIIVGLCADFAHAGDDSEQNGMIATKRYKQFRVGGAKEADPNLASVQLPGMDTISKLSDAVGGEDLDVFVPKSGNPEDTLTRQELRERQQHVARVDHVATNRKAHEFLKHANSNEAQSQLTREGKDAIAHQKSIIRDLREQIEDCNHLIVRKSLSARQVSKGSFNPSEWSRKLVKKVKTLKGLRISQSAQAEHNVEILYKQYDDAINRGLEIFTKKHTDKYFIKDDDPVTFPAAPVSKAHADSILDDKSADDGDNDCDLDDIDGWLDRMEQKEHITKQEREGVVARTDKDGALGESEGEEDLKLEDVYEDVRGFESYAHAIKIMTSPRFSNENPLRNKTAAPFSTGSTIHV